MRMMVDTKHATGFFSMLVALSPLLFTAEIFAETAPPTPASPSSRSATLPPPVHHFPAAPQSPSAAAAPSYAASTVPPAASKLPPPRPSVFMPPPIPQISSAAPSPLSVEQWQEPGSPPPLRGPRPSIAPGSIQNTIARFQQGPASPPPRPPPRNP